MKIKLYILSIFILLAVGYVYSQIYAPNNQAGNFSIENGETLKTISYNLKEQNLIKNEDVFYAFFHITSNAENIKAGNYNIEPEMSSFNIMQKFLKGESFSQKILIPEGWTIKDIGKYLKERNICTIEEFNSALELNWKENFSFLENDLEGFLFPDTYYLGGNETAEDIIKMMLQNFKQKALPIISKQDLLQTITLASLLEKEVIGAKDKQLVADILLKRLEIGMALQVDATIDYAEEISNELYDTYENSGLPPGPICNPGIESIKAALDPLPNEYWFYLSAKDGTTIFSHNFEEHKYNKNIYLR